MRARGGLLGWLAILVLVQASCAEIPTAPKRLVTLQGTILTRDGDPVPGAQVFLGDLMGYQSSFRSLYGVTTGSDGAYKLDLAEGTYEVRVIPDYRTGIQTASASGFRVAGDHPRFDYTYGGLRLEGTVRDPHGVPCPLVNLGFYSVYRPQTPTVHVSFVAYDGHFRVYLPPGDYDLRATPFAATSGVPTRTFRSVHFAADSTFDVVLTGHRITGRTTGPDGSPLAGATISYESDDSETSSAANSQSDGSYELYAPDGVYRIEAFPASDDFEIQARPFGQVAISGDLNRDLAFVGTWWQGTVRSPEDGSPIAGALVEAEILDVSYDYGARTARATTDSNGVYRLSVVSGAWHRFYVGGPNRKWVDTPPIPAGADSTVDLVAGPLYGSSVTPIPRGARAAAR
jgi:hypothetical protein